MQKKELTLSVVVPVRNRAGIVTRTLDSIASQNYRPFELIIVDNGSDDGTPAVLEEWKRGNVDSGLDVVVTECNTPGAAAARNAGLRLASGAWVMFFDSDDLMLPSHLKRIAAAIEEHPEVDIIGWDVIFERLDGSYRRCRFFGRDMQRHNLFDGAMSTQRWTARTELVKKVGAWDENVGYWDDIELGSRLLAATSRVRYIGTGGVHVKESRESISSAGARNPESIEPALIRMENTIGPRGRRWCRLKRAVEYALNSRSGSADGLRLMKAMNASPWLWLAYHYTRLGGRGVARLMRF